MDLPLKFLTNQFMYNEMKVNHIGSRRFRDTIDTYRDRYRASTTKYEKMVITKEIYNKLKIKKYRFLKFNKQRGGWEEVSIFVGKTIPVHPPGLPFFLHFIFLFPSRLRYLQWLLETRQVPCRRALYSFPISFENVTIVDVLLNFFLMSKL